MYRERKTWSSRKFGERKFFFGEDDVFQMKEFRTTLIYIYINTYVLIKYNWTYVELIDRDLHHQTFQPWASLDELEMS